MFINFEAICGIIGTNTCAHMTISRFYSAIANISYLTNMSDVSNNKNGWPEYVQTQNVSTIVFRGEN